jgi:plasmid stabilization system protein ParE
VSLVVQPDAETEITNAALWYHEQSSAIRDSFLTAVDQALQAIEQRPLLYQRIYKQVRRLVLREFPYALFYTVSSQDVVVIACLHCSRDPKLWRKRVP